MKKKLLIILIILSSINQIKSQTSWELLNPNPTANTGKDIDFVSNNVGYIITPTELLETLDSGNTWTKKQNISSGNDMNFYDNIGYIVGNDGYILKSTDSGNTWTQIFTSFNISFNTVNIIDKSIIILSGPNGIVKSDDGGITWQSLNIPNTTINKFFFTNSLLGHAASFLGKIYKTTDGGVNWHETQITNAYPSNFHTIYFFNETTGFACQNRSKIYKTIDGGESWFIVSENTGDVYDVYFLDENNGFRTGEYGATFKTTNGGDSWIHIPFQNGGIDNTSMYGIYFQDNNIGYATGDRGRIIKTTDGGNTWVEHSPTYNKISKIEFINNNTAFASVIGGTFIKTTDTGSSWFQMGKPYINAGLINDFDFVNENIGYAIIDRMVYKTINGGNNWYAKNNGLESTNVDLYSIAFINQDIGYVSGVFGNESKVMKTMDGGNTWITHYTNQNETFEKLQFFNNLIGYAHYSNSQSMYKTIDGGKTWSISTNVDQEIRTFDFIDEDNGFFVGDQGLIYKTNNGGTTWKKLSIPNELYNHNAVKFYSKDVGYIGEVYGRIYKTMDGGESWEFLTILNGLNSIELIDDYIFTANSNGKIYRSQTGLLDVNKLPKNLKTSIYPNPAKDFVNIKLKNFTNVNFVEVHDILGKLVFSKKIQNNLNLITIDTSNFNKGIYFLNIISKSNGKISSKLVLN